MESSACFPFFSGKTYSDYLGRMRRWYDIPTSRNTKIEHDVYMYVLRRLAMTTGGCCLAVYSIIQLIIATRRPLVGLQINVGPKLC